MTKPESLPVEDARKKFADILDGTQFRSTHTEITRRGKTAGYVVPPEWYARAVEALAREQGAPPPVRQAAVAPRARVSTPLPPEPSLEAEPLPPLPEITEKQFRKVITLAQSRATPDQRQRLNRTAKVAEQTGRNRHDEILKAAFEMGLLSHDEVYGERPVSGEETNG